MNAQAILPSPPPIRRLAIIDDAEFDQMLYARLIERTGQVEETLSFFSAEDAIGYFEGPDARPVDVLLLDINMPGMSGFDFLEHVTRTNPGDYAGIVIVMLTTSLNPSDIQRAASYECIRDYIRKPLEPEHLARLARLLSGGCSAQDRPADARLQTASLSSNARTIAPYPPSSR